MSNVKKPNTKTDFNQLKQEPSANQNIGYKKLVLECTKLKEEDFQKRAGEIMYELATIEEWKASHACQFKMQINKKYLMKPDAVSDFLERFSMDNSSHGALDRFYSMIDSIPKLAILYVLKKTDDPNFDTTSMKETILKHFKESTFSIRNMRYINTSELTGYEVIYESNLRISLYHSLMDIFDESNGYKVLAKLIYGGPFFVPQRLEEVVKKFPDIEKDFLRFLLGFHRLAGMTYNKRFWPIEYLDHAPNDHLDVFYVNGVPEIEKFAKFLEEHTFATRIPMGDSVCYEIICTKSFENNLIQKLGSMKITRTLDFPDAFSTSQTQARLERNPRLDYRSFILHRLPKYET